MSDCKIIFPPQFEPFQPYLSGPYLKSLFAHHGIPLFVFDANIDFYEWLIVTAREGVPWPTAPNGSDAYLREHIGEALQVLRYAPRSLPEYHWAVNVADEYLRAISPEGVKIGLTYLKVGNRYSTSDLRAYLDRSDNIFRFYFEQAEDRLLGPPSVSTYLLSLVVIDQLPAAITFAREIKKRRTKARIIVGGPIISRIHRQLSAVPWIAEVFDAIVPGEGYRILPDILGLERAYRSHITPDFSDLDLDQYWSCCRVLPYLIAHGCKWGRCAFCSHRLTYEGYWESKMSDVLSDLSDLSRKHQGQYISFCDEYLTPAQLQELSTGLLEREIDIRWSTFARPEPQFCDPEFLLKLYNAGCRLLMFGMESASQRVLNAMKKGTRVEHFRPIIEACKIVNIAVRYDFMVGFPGETEEDVQKTYSFIRQNRDLIDTPFSSYAVAVFELRSEIPVLEQAEQFHILPKALLRGDLDDQYGYEFEGDSGLTEHTRIEWRERLIRFFKMEMDAELICPQNKTHQLILKDLWDEGVFDLPVLHISPDSLEHLVAKLAPGVELVPQGDSLRVVNHANGGELEVSMRLYQLFMAFFSGLMLSLNKAFLLQDLWEQDAFAKLITFLYRNDYLVIHNLSSTRSVETMNDNARLIDSTPKDLVDYAGLPDDTSFT